jgi:hypothetical protein
MMSLPQYYRTCSPVQLYYYYSTDVQEQRYQSTSYYLYCTTVLQYGVMLSDVKCLWLMGNGGLDKTLQHRKAVVRVLQYHLV